MNILFINIFFVGFMVSESHRVFEYCPYSDTFPHFIIDIRVTSVLMLSCWRSVIL